MKKLNFRSVNRRCINDITAVIHALSSILKRRYFYSAGSYGLTISKIKTLFCFFVITQLLVINLASAQTNTRPRANAGADRNIAASTSSISLTGTASDPDGTIIRYAWSKVKGPSATLTNANRPTVTLTNLRKGIYVFRLTVTDNSTDANTNTAFDDVVVIYDQPVQKTHTQGGTPQSQLYYWEYLPEDYATSNASKKYPLIVFLHGCEERSYTSNCNTIISTSFDSLRSYNELDKVLKFGPPNEMASGVKMCFKNPSNFEECFIVLSPQLSGRDTKAWDSNILQNFLTKAFDRYPKIDRSRVYLTGLSIGGIGTYAFAQSTQSLATSITAIAPVAARGDASNACILKNRNIPVWAFHGDRDTVVPFSAGRAMIENLTNCNPNPIPRFTVYPGQAHTPFVFNTPYKTASPDGNYPEKLYEWFLKFNKGGGSAPVVNAGADRTITLPANSVTLTGSAVDADGISTYLWVKQSGPAATLSATNQATLTVSNMVQGTYVFSLSATDTQGMSASDEVHVVVNAIPGGGTDGSVISFSLIHALTGNVVSTFTNAIELNKNEPDFPNWVIQANTSSPVGSVKYKINGRQTNIDNTIPYLINRNVLLSLATGTHTLLAEPFAEPHGHGLRGVGLAASVHVVDHSQLQQSAFSVDNVSIYPVPFAKELTVSVSKKVSGQVEMSIITLTGTVVHKETVSGDNLNASYTVDAGHLTKGVYYLRIVSSDGLHETRRILKE